MDDENVTWWQWLANTAVGAYNSKLCAEVALETAKNKNTTDEDKKTLSFLGMELNKETLLWIAGGTVLTVFVVVILRKK